jgi:chitin disaccharide deacetylase
MKSGTRYLIVNADDFGYFRGVSRGIIDAHRRGIVTATGIFANGPGLERDIDLLRSAESLDLGVHLNVTSGPVLSSAMRERARATGGCFSGKLAFARGFVSGWISVRDVEEEWRAQVEHCLGQGLRLMFLNSHEHIHMFPSLFELVQELALEYQVPYVRLPAAEWLSEAKPAALVRDTAIKWLEARNVRRLKVPAPFFLGMRASGKLTERDIARNLESMRPGRVYELMCHPGYLEPDNVAAKELRSYHDWEQEMDALCSASVANRLAQAGVRLINYRDLETLENDIEMQSGQ